MSSPSTSFWAETATAVPPQAALAATQEALHDARQALGTILALLEAGSKTVGDPALTLRRLKQIESELRVLWGLIQVNEPGHEDALVDVGNEACELVRALAVESPGRIGVVADTAARVRMSQTTLHRILTNLLRNALRAAGDDGYVQVTVTADTEDVVVLVEDDGPGLGALPVIHGVGLRSVARLVGEAGGIMNAQAHGRLGGASVRVCVPAASRGPTP